MHSPQHNITYRLANQDDDAFLFDLFVQTRQSDFQNLSMDDNQKQMLLRWQYQAQSKSYFAHHPDLTHFIILNHGEPVGRFMFNESENDLHIVDIAVMPQTQNQGIGSAVIQKYIEYGKQTHKKVWLQVFKTNKAKHLYERMGFQITSENDLQYTMEWSEPS